jgi:hypothetical protein
MKSFFCDIKISGNPHLLELSGRTVLPMYCVYFSKLLQTGNTEQLISGMNYFFNRSIFSWHFRSWLRSLKKFLSHLSEPFLHGPRYMKFSEKKNMVCTYVGLEGRENPRLCESRKHDE